MKLVAHKPNWMEICLSAKDLYGNVESRWVTYSNPLNYLQYLDQYALAEDFSWYLATHRDEKICGATFRTYLVKLGVCLPSKGLESFALYCFEDIAMCYPEGDEYYYYEAVHDVFLNGQQYKIVYSQEDLEMAVLRMYIQWKYRSK